MTIYGVNMMKKIKGILSIIVVLAILGTVFSLIGTVYATENSSITEVDVPQNVQDGVILHAFCWGYSEIEKNLEGIARAGYTAIQTSPVQQPKDKASSTDVTGQWWKLYQPVSFAVADNTWLGTKEELTSLCKSAENYGIKIICDVVLNHLGASSDNGYSMLAKEIQTYEPVIWNSTGVTKNNPYFHQRFSSVSDASTYYVTQGLVSSCPDLNTGNEYVQQRATALLKECIDCGVDGFRFDGAKHIETSQDGTYASDFWDVVLGGARTYAQSLDRDVYFYGEILNTPGTGRNYSYYTDLMSVTDNTFSNKIRSAITGKNVAGTVIKSYNVGSAKKAVLWAESHDTYLGSSGNTSSVSNENIVKTWALVASRKDATALYFARPDSMSMGGAALDTTYKSVAVTEINKFHNLFVGESEKVGLSSSFSYVSRGGKGIVIVNTNGTTANVSISSTDLADGEYTDMISGNKFTVSSGKISGLMGETGVAVVTQGTTTPTVFADKESQTFGGESITLKLTLSNAISGTYQLDNYAPVAFTGSPVIKIGGDYDYGETIKLTLTATDGSKTTSTVYNYTKTEAATSGVYVILPASTISKSGWTTPVYCYMYDEKSGSSVYQNAAWPGQAMEYDSVLDCYYVQVSNLTCMNSSGSQVTFSLADSSYTNVIISDSANSPHQYPAAFSSITLKLNSTSHKFSSISTSGWVQTTEVPGEVIVEATEVSKGGTNTSNTETTESTGDTQPTSPSSGETEPETTEPTEPCEYTYEVVDGGIQITGYNGSDTKVVVPQAINGYSVIKIGDNAFKNQTNIESITLPNTVKSIGSYSFRGCTNLSSIELGTSVSTIGRYAFMNCSSLASITIPQSISSIEAWAFSGTASGFTVYGYAGTASETFAHSFGYTFVNISVVLGDVDNDGAVTINDVTFVQKSVVKLVSVSDDQLSRGDVTGDGKLSTLDATYMQLYIARRITKFPAEK